MQLIGKALLLQKNEMILPNGQWKICNCNFLFGCYQVFLRQSSRWTQDHDQGDLQDRCYCFSTSAIGKSFKIAGFISTWSGLSILKCIKYGFDSYSIYSYTKVSNTLKNEVGKNKIPVSNILYKWKGTEL